jgi:hypothetical protein
MVTRIWTYQIQPAFQEFTEKFPNVLYEQCCETLRYTFHRFRERGSVQRKPGPKVRTEENIETVQRRMEDEPQLSFRRLSQQTELSVSTYQRIVRKDLEDSVTAERYRNNILDVFIN